MIYYIRDFQGGALGFFRDALVASKGWEGRREKAKTQGAASCTPIRAQFVYFMCYAQVSI